VIGRTLKNILEKKNINVTQLSRETGISPQTLYSVIKRDNMKIDFDVLLKLCRALDVPVQTFYGESYETPDMPTPEEWQILAQLRTLDPHGREAAQAIIKLENDRIKQEQEKEQEPKTAKTRIIPLYYTAAAAGYVSPAMGEDYEPYEVSDQTTADFAAKIQGDSMEPYIEDGQIVLVRREGVTNGDVGLFFVDGDMKCKQYCRDNFGNTYLFSLNRDRADADISIPSSSGITVCCFGKVLLSRCPPLP